MVRVRVAVQELTVQEVSCNRRSCCSNCLSTSIGRLSFCQKIPAQTKLFLKAQHHALSRTAVGSGPVVLQPIGPTTQ